MKKYVLYFIFAVFMAGSFIQTLNAQKQFHLILFANPDEPGREKDRRVSAKNTIEFFREISAQIGYSYNTRYYNGQDFTGTKALSVVKSLNINSGDVVVFYYQGHGYNDKSDKWPTLAFHPSPNSHSEMVRMTDIALAITPRTEDKAYLTMIIGECCNSYMNSNQLPPVSYSTNNRIARKLKKLFANPEENYTILMSSSIQGQVSWSDLNEGSIHGICFRASLWEAVSDMEEPTWNDILMKNKNYVLQATQNQQKPQYNITVDKSVR